jgi:hypothetical protein
MSFCRRIESWLLWPVWKQAYKAAKTRFLKLSAVAPQGVGILFKGGRRFLKNYLKYRDILAQYGKLVRQ